MNVLPSRAMRRLEAAIAAAGNPGEAACLQAERACLLARQGRFDEAREVLDRLRAESASASPALAAWLCLGDGLIDHYRQMGASSRDRIRRAYALSVAARARPLIALSAAWLAHFDYVYGDLEGMARHIAEALQEADAEHHAARARACLVAAMAYHWGGRLDLAQPFYDRSRRHATAEGDEATISSLLVNRAWVCGNQTRLAAIFETPDRPDADAIRQALLSADSAGAFDQHVRKQSLSSFVPMLRAQLLIVQGQHAEGLAVYEAHLPTALSDGLAYMQPVFFADIAWSKVQLGRRDEALADARSAQECFDADCEEEDCAVAHGRLAQVFECLGLADEARVHREQALAQLEQLRAQQRRVVELLDGALAKVHDLR